MRCSIIAGATLACMLAPTIASGELYLIAGTPTPNENLVGHFALALFRVGSDGALHKAADLVPGDVGTEWIGISDDRREALIYPKDQTAIVLDLDTAKVAKRCELPKIPAYLITQFLADVPGRGLTFEWFRSGPPPVGNRIQGMALDPAVPCDRSFVTIGPTENRFVAAQGGAGTGSVLCGDGVAGFIDADGNIAGPVFGPDDTHWGYRVPSELIAGRDEPNVGVIVNDSKMLIIVIKEEPNHPSSLLEFRKRDKTWHVLPRLHGEWIHIRSFGKYIAITETGRKKIGPERFPRTLEDAKRMVDQESMSPGIEEWRTALWKKEPTPGIYKFGLNSQYGPDLFFSFDATSDVFPGRLHLYNIDTEKIRTIETNQGDSEILLVEGDTAYYRVNDRLYSAPIGPDEIGPPKQIAKDEIIRDAHYAFMSH